jgi:hypothetical protein
MMPEMNKRLSPAQQEPHIAIVMRDRRAEFLTLS